MIKTVAKITCVLSIVSLICPIAASYAMHDYSFIKNMTIKPLSAHGNIVTVSVTFDIYFTAQAWQTFKYKDGSYGYMSNWWEHHEGRIYSYAGHSAKLLDIDWTLLHHYCDHDRLRAVVKLQILR